MNRSTYLHRLALAKRHSAASLLLSGDIRFPLGSSCSIIYRPGQAAKYLKTGSSGSHLFVPKHAGEFETVVVVEGIFCALVLADTQPFHVPVLPVAILGCSINDDLRKKIVAVSQDKEIILMLDRDTAGIEATKISHTKYSCLFKKCIVPITKDAYDDYSAGTQGPYLTRDIDELYPLGEEQLYRRAMNSNNSDYVRKWHEYRQGDQVNPNSAATATKKQAVVR